MSPSRRRVLQTCSLAVVGGLAGCGANTDTDDESADTPTDTDDGSTPDNSQDPPVNDATYSLSAHSRTDEEVTLTVTVTRDGEQVTGTTATLRPGVAKSLDVDVDSGEYTVEASLDSGASATYDWVVPAGYDGSLAVLVTEDGLTFRETLANPSCPTAELPYAIDGAPETFTTGGARIQNASGASQTATLTVAHEGTSVFSCTQELTARQAVTIEDLIATAGTYTVTVDVEGGEQTVSEWRVPEENNYPTLRVVLGEDGPLVGCGPGGDVRVSVENPTDDTRTVYLSLRRDEETVADETVEVAADSEADVRLSAPIGGFYTLVATADGTEASAEVVECYCYESDRTTVTLEESGPSVDSSILVCE